MPNYDYSCISCGEEFIKVMPYEERDSEKIKCSFCGSTGVKRIYSNFPGLTKASYLDGTKRFSGLKTEAKLRAAREQTRPGSKEHTEISKEINARNKRGE